MTAEMIKGVLILNDVALILLFIGMAAFAWLWVKSELKLKAYGRSWLFKTEDQQKKELRDKRRGEHERLIIAYIGARSSHKKEMIRRKYEKYIRRLAHCKNHSVTINDMEIHAEDYKRKMKNREKLGN